MATHDPQSFEVQLQYAGPGAATFFVPPLSVEAAFGSKGLTPVAGTLNGHSFRSSLFPNGDGTHYMVVNQPLRAAAGVKAGDTVQVTMERDTAPRVVEVPEDVQQSLAANNDAQARFSALSYSHQREYVEWIVSAKRPDTRARRIEKTVAMLVEGKRLKN